MELEKDLAELNKFIEQSTRLNIRRNLENQKKTITGLVESEKKLLEKKKDLPHEDTLIDTTDDKYKYTTITNYAFESSEKFAK